MWTNFIISRSLISSVTWGAFFTRDCKDDSDVLARINSAGGAFGAERKALFSNSEIKFAAKKVVYEGLILKILLYGSESWCLTEKLLNLLRRFHARCGVFPQCRLTDPPSNFAPLCQMIELGPLTKNHPGFRGLRPLVQKL